MRANPRTRVVLAAAPLWLLILMTCAGEADALLSGSRHDFTYVNNPNPALVTRGRCAACHEPHGSQPSARLWPRSLAQENAYYSLGGNPDYRPGATVYCYDCHDEAAVGRADADPAPTGWQTGHRPQDIALGSDATGPVGYYELADGTLPTSANAPKSTDASVTTGGHYWKTEPTGNPDYRRGDKIACELCHDPHNAETGTNDVFFRTVAASGNGSTVALGNGLRASPNVRNHQAGGTGREMCAACHKYADTGGPAVTLWGVVLPKPPATTAEHLSSSTVPCTSCHRHNKISVSCNACHTYPGLANPGGATHRLSAVHDVHVGVPSSEAAVPNLGLACEACHSGAVHNAGPGGTIGGAAQWATLVAPNINARVQVRFSAALNPLTVNPADPTLDSTSYDDAGNVCSSLYCHGDDAANFGPASGTDTTPDWDVAATGDCGTCHDTGTDDTTSPGTSIGTGNHADHLTAAWGPLLGTDKDVACLACHPAYALSPSAPHANGTKSFLNLDDATVTALAATNACDNCHGASATSAKTPANWSNGAYLLNCLECHDAADPANSSRSGTGLAAPAKSAHWTTRGHGNVATYPWGAGRAGAALQCAACHAPASAHLDGSLGQDRLTAAGNALCSGCHDGAGAGAAVTQVSTHANTSGTMGSPPVNYTAQRAAFELNCVECHDVHGTANIFMVNTDDPDAPLTAPRTYNGSADTATLLFRGGAVAFTADAAGADFAATTADANKICQTCHTTTGGAGTPVYQHNNPTSGHATSKCTGCHGHDVDANFAANSQDGFMPRGGDCASCHDAASPYDPDAGGPKAPAPAIDMAAWAVSGHGQATNPAVICTDCHDIGLPDAPVTHLDGTYNSIWENGAVVTRNANTAHLRPEFFTPYTGVGAAGNAWDIQVTFDNRCYNQCHAAKLVKDMRHEVDTPPAAHHHWSVKMGTHLSYPDGDRSGTPGDDGLNAPYPIDCDLNTGANCADTDYAPCVSCHDPHGTALVEPESPPSNFMMRRKWITLDADPFLCRGCHP